MVGAGSVLLNTLLGLPQPAAPSWVNGMLQIMLGMLVGSRMTREELRSSVRAPIPASVLSVILISATIVAVLIVSRLTSVDLVTALFATAPGGLIEMSVVSLGFEADEAAVISVQLVRVLLALAVIDILLKRFESKNEPDSDQEQEDDSAEETELTEDLKELGIAAPWGIVGGSSGSLARCQPVGYRGTDRFRIFPVADRETCAGQQVPTCGSSIGRRGHRA
jgi:membrane AbrB-like protein